MTVKHATANRTSVLLAFKKYLPDLNSEIKVHFTCHSGFFHKPVSSVEKFPNSLNFNNFPHSVKGWNFPKVHSFSPSMKHFEQSRDETEGAGCG